MLPKKFIPYSRQTIDAGDIKAVIKVLRSDYLTQGPTISAFEKKVATYCNVKHAVAFSSGTAALHGACFAAKIGVGDEVITTPITFAASANCILYVGGTPVFADIKKEYPLIDPQEIKKRITKNTRAIIPVDYSGMPADYDEINALARKHNLIVIADAAHSLGATYKGKKVGALADMTVLSFHPVKSITTGEGGMVVTNHKNFYERLLLLRNQGITRDKKKLVNKTQGDWFYEMQELGFNYRLTDIQAALGLSQLEKIDKLIAARRNIIHKYDEAFKYLSKIKALDVPNNRTSAWHLYPIQIKAQDKNRKHIFNKFHQIKIKVQVHYIPIHLHPYYQKEFGYKTGDYPNSEKFYREELSLPVFPKITKYEMQSVISATKKFLS